MLMNELDSPSKPALPNSSDAKLASFLYEALLIQADQ